MILLTCRTCLAERERSDSPPTRDTPSVTRVARVPSDDIEKLQMEMELCLQQIESVQRRALSGELLHLEFSMQMCVCVCMYTVLAQSKVRGVLCQTRCYIYKESYIHHTYHKESSGRW